MVLAHPLVLLLTVAQTLPPVDDAWVPPGPGWGYQLLVGSLIVLALLGGGAACCPAALTPPLPSKPPSPWASGGRS